MAELVLVFNDHGRLTAIGGRVRARDFREQMRKLRMINEDFSITGDEQ